MMTSRVRDRELPVTPEYPKLMGKASGLVLLMTSQNEGTVVCVGEEDSTVHSLGEYSATWNTFNMDELPMGDEVVLFNGS